MNSNRKITRSEKKLFVTGSAIAFIIAVGAWRQWVDAIPEVEIPSPQLPSPNAYDFYVKAGAAILPASSAVGPVFDTKVVPEAQWKTRYPTINKEAWLLQNTKALVLLKKGFHHPCRVPPKRTLNSMFNTPFRSFRNLARMLTTQSHAHSERGNWRGAADSMIDILHLGHGISQSGTLIDFLASTAVSAIGRREFWKILPHLNAAESKSLARRLEKIIDQRATYASLLQEGKYYGQATLIEEMRSKDWRTAELSDSTGLARWKELMRMTTTPHRVVFMNYSD